MEEQHEQETAPPVYLYDGKTGRLKDFELADPDPLRPGEWLVPRNATLVEPPDFKCGYAAHFVEDRQEWELRRDYEAEREHANSIRSIRMSHLRSSDWTQLPDAPLSDEQRQAWRKYRQEWRDITARPGFPFFEEGVDWVPKPPTRQKEASNG